VVRQSIEVPAPIDIAYEPWVWPSDYPRFFKGVSNVTQLDADRVCWFGSFGGRRRSWITTWSALEPFGVVAWTTEDGPSDLEVYLHSIGPLRTHVEVVERPHLHTPLQRLALDRGLTQRRLHRELESYGRLVRARARVARQAA
jgi:hypothetical protein